MTHPRGPRIRLLPHLACTTTLGVLLAQSACFYHWQEQSAAPASVIVEQRPAVIRLTRTDSSQIILHHPQISDSALTGLSADSLRVVPLTQVRRVAVRKRGANTPVKVVAGMVSLGLLIYAVTWDPFGP